MKGLILEEKFADDAQWSIKFKKVETSACLQSWNKFHYSFKAYTSGNFDILAIKKTYQYSVSS